MILTVENSETEQIDDNFRKQNCKYIRLCIVG